MKQQKNLSPRAQEMYTLIEKYFTTNLNQKTFCEQQGITYSTFHWWLSKYKNNSPTSMTNRSKSSGDFIPVHVGSPDTSTVFSSVCYIEYPNGVIVHLLDVNVQVISELIQFQTN